VFRYRWTRLKKTGWYSIFDNAGGLLQINIRLALIKNELKNNKSKKDTPCTVVSSFSYE